MSAPDDPPLSPGRGEPIADLMLAQALEACIAAERAQRGSSAHVIARAPAAARVELRGLMRTVRTLEAASATAAPSPEFRAAARKRLMRRIGGTRAPGVYEQPRNLASGRPTPAPRATGDPRRRWLRRCLAGLSGALAAASATLSVSASALPGDTLYGFKQAHEELGLRLVGAAGDPAGPPVAPDGR